jgi:MtfA peptidase
MMASTLAFLGVLIAIQVLRYTGQKDKLHRYYTSNCLPPEVLPTEIVIEGKDLKISDYDLNHILKKRFKYYASLDENLQQEFLRRLKVFMLKKIFIIKDDEGVKEMPVLVSASAIGLTFGLNDFRFPFYKYIRIYPEEYVAEDSLKILAGNVQNNVITIAWDHLLEGYNNFSDGSNVGLHEMSHALYIQKIVIEQGYANKFLQKYNCLLKECREASNMEAEEKKDIYSDYANINLQEFWAESVELFFEKPAALNSNYPNVFEGLTLLLNQNPVNKANPVLKTRLSFNRKLNEIIHVLKVTGVKRDNLN